MTSYVYCCSFKTWLMLECNSGIFSSSLNTGTMTDRSVPIPDPPTTFSIRCFLLIPFYKTEKLFKQILRFAQDDSVALGDSIAQDDCVVRNDTVARSPKTSYDFPSKLHYINDSKCPTCIFGSSFFPNCFRMFQICSQTCEQSGVHRNISEPRYDFFQPSYACNMLVHLLDTRYHGLRLKFDNSLLCHLSHMAAQLRVRQ